MDDQELNPSETVPGADDVASSEGNENGSVVSAKDLLSGITGRKYDSDEAALKSVKDTYGYVGKVGNYLPVIEKLEQKYGKEAAKKMEEILNPQPKQEIDTSKFITSEQLAETLWYKDNKEFEQYKNVISAVQKAEGHASPQDAIEKSETLKALIEKARTGDEFNKSRSVLQTNPRLGQVTDKMNQARGAVEAAMTATNSRDYSQKLEEAKNGALGAVLDAYSLR